MVVSFDIRCSIVPMTLRNYEILPLLLSSVLIIVSDSVTITVINTNQLGIPFNIILCSPQNYCNLNNLLHLLSFRYFEIISPLKENEY